MLEGGLSKSQALTWSSIIGICQICGNITSLFMTDYLGKKRLLMMGLSGMLLGFSLMVLKKLLSLENCL